MNPVHPGLWRARQGSGDNVQTLVVGGGGERGGYEPSAGGGGFGSPSVPRNDREYRKSTNNTGGSHGPSKQSMSSLMGANVSPSLSSVIDRDRAGNGGSGGGGLSATAEARAASSDHARAVVEAAAAGMGAARELGWEINWLDGEAP